MSSYRRMAALKTAEDFLGHVQSLGVQIPLSQTVDPHGALAQPLRSRQQSIGNRFCILPMEGWDGTTDGKPSDLTIRRWKRFGQSGAKLIWGGEAVAVRQDGRANPNQLVMTDANLAEIAQLRTILLNEHQQQFGKTDDLLLGLQLTHSGRFARPNDKAKMEPMILYRHPVLDRKFKLSEAQPILTDEQIDRLIEDFIVAGKRAWQAGYAFVDVKHCHGYLGHEFLSAVDRPGKYGGSFENRTRFLRTIVAGLKAEVPELQIGVRLSMYDFIPFRPGAENKGEPDRINESTNDYSYAFGGDGTGTGLDSKEPKQFLDVCRSLGIELICTTAGSPYYTPHLQRPALFPPSDGYQPPEDPLVGVARQISFAAELKRHAPDLIFVGSGFTYLQDWLPNVGQAVIEQGLADSIGLGRMVLSYPELPADVLAGRTLQRKKICRTFSECTSAPRNGLISGCFPLDEFYKQRPEAQTLQQILAVKK